MSTGYDLERLRAGRRLEFRDEVASTQDLAFTLAEHGAADGTLVLAERQTRGRGRLGRSWVSAPGLAVECSLVLRPGAGAVPSLLVAATALAVADALEGVAGLAPAVRWPNDLLVRDRKICGILLETRDFEPAAPLFVLGVGLNAGQAAADLPPGATSVLLESGRAPDRTALLAAILDALRRRRAETAAAVDAAFRERAAYRGRRVRLLAGEERVEGILESASPLEGVLLRLDGGGARTVRPEHARDLRPAFLLRPAVPADAEAIVRVNGDAWRAAYRGIFPDAVLERRGREPGDLERRRKYLESPDRHCTVAEEEGAVVAFVMAGRPRDAVPGFDAEIHAVYVLPSHQGRGFGRVLMADAAAALAARGARSAFLWTLRDNPASRAFYDRLGGRVAAERTATVEGAEVAEVAYGWEDLGTLAPSP